MTTTLQPPVVDASIGAGFEEWLKTRPDAASWETKDGMLAAFIGGIAFRESAAVAEVGDAARIGNSLAGHGLMPRKNQPKANEAQAHADAGKSDPFPMCFCGRPSNQHLMGPSIYCSEAHLCRAKRWAKGFSHEAFDES